jgi:iron complex transport system substrate-binding protein
MAPPSPRRIVSLTESCTEILSFLGFSDQVTTLQEYCEDVPAETDRKNPEYWFTMALGRILSLKPDLVITQSPSQQDLHKRIKEKGIPTMHLDSRSLREVEDSFLQIGKAVGAVENARQLARDFAGGFTALREKIPPGAYRPKLYCEDWNKPPSAAGGWCPELMTQAGAHYFPMLSHETSRQVRIEEMVKFDPEVLIFAIRGEGLQFNPDEALKRIGWEKITAVRKRRIYSVQQELLNWPSPRLPEGAKLIQGILGQSFWGWPLFNSPLVRKVLD